VSSVDVLEITLDSDDNLCSFNDTVVLYHAKKRESNRDTAEPDRSVGAGIKKDIFSHDVNKRKNTLKFSYSTYCDIHFSLVFWTAGDMWKSH